MVDYVLVSQDDQRVEVYTRQSTSGWLLQSYEDGAVVLPSLGVTLQLDAIYRATGRAAR